MREKNCYPIIHFAPEYGWLNDPNGLVWHDGIFELYYQSNPNGLEWWDMTWSHARSTDLMHWEQKEPVMYPDENGTMFSGCGLRNDRGLMDLPKDALLFPYTVCPIGPKYERDTTNTIRMAYSTDGGDTFVKKDGILLDTPAAFARDPKVFWHEESQAYILVLWIEDADFGIWRSTDLEWFTFSSRVTLEGGFECPDLNCLKVYDENGEPTGESKWVFWAADGSYYLGEFDGYTFTQTQPRMHAYALNLSLPYAAQTWSGVPDGRVISVAWLRSLTVAHQYTGMMSLPRELSLVKKGPRYFLRQKTAEEILSAARAVPLEKGTSDDEYNAVLECDAAVRIRCSAEKDFSMEILGEDQECMISFEYDHEKAILAVTLQEVTELVRLGFRGDVSDLDLIYDRGILELSANKDTSLAVIDRPSLRSRIAAAVKVCGKPDCFEVSTIC